MYYRGFKEPPKGSRARVENPGRSFRTYGLRLPKEGASSNGFFSFRKGKGEKSRTSQRESTVSYGFYRPGDSEKKEAPAPKALGFSRRSWGGMKGVLKGAVLLGMIGLAAWGKNQVLGRLQDASGFRLARVSVEGNRFLKTDDLLKAAALPIGENMFKLDLSGAAERLERLDWVEKAFLERRLPQTILISVRERKIVALLDSGTLFGVTGEGRVLSPNEELARQDLPLLSGVGVPLEALGTTHLASSLEPGLGFLAFVGKQGGGLAQEISEVNLSDPRALKVTLIDGITATFNPPVTAAELRRLNLVRDDLARKGLRAGSMDFRYKDTVLVKVM